MHKEGQHREHRGRDRERRRQSADERRVAQQRHVEHRLALPELGDDEQQPATGRPRRATRSRRGPNPRRASSTRISPYTSSASARAERQEAQPIRPAGPRVARLGDAQAASARPATTPIGTLTKKIQRHDEPARDQPRRGPDRPQRRFRSSPRTRQTRCRDRATESLRQQRQRGGEHDRAADALSGTRERSGTAGSAPARRAPSRR